MPKKKPSNEVTSFYDLKDVKRHVKKSENPNKDAHYIDIPFRLLCVGSSGAGKTTIALEIIKRMKNTFDFIVLVVRSIEEPLYQYLLRKCKGQIYAYEIDSKTPVPTLDDLLKFKGEPNDQILVIYDDLVALKKQDMIEDAFIRARKFGLSLMYLTQSFYRTPKVIRLNCNYVVVKKVANLRDIKMMLSEYNLGIDKEDMLKSYNKCTSNKTDFMMIRLDLPTDDPLKFTCNFFEPLF